MMYEKQKEDYDHCLKDNECLPVFRSHHLHFLDLKCVVVDLIFCGYMFFLYTFLVVCFNKKHCGYKICSSAETQWQLVGTMRCFG